MNISIRQLDAFIKVADNGSFTRASEQMHLTQSAVSGLIKELETNLEIVFLIALPGSCRCLQWDEICCRKLVECSMKCTCLSMKQAV